MTSSPLISHSVESLDEEPLPSDGEDTGKSVLFVSHTGRCGGGGEVVFGQLIEACAATGRKIFVAAPSGDLVEELRPLITGVYQIPEATIRRSKDPRRAARSSWAWLRGAYAVGSALRDSGAGIVHANSGVAALLALPGTMVLRRALIWHQHDIVPRRRINTLVLGVCGRGASAIVACSRAVARSLQNLGIPSEKVAVIYNCARSEFFTDDGQGIRRECPPLAVIAGRLVPYKGFHVFLEALAILLKRGVPVHGLVAGDVPQFSAGDADPFPGYANRLWQRTLDPDLEGHVTFAGHVEHMRDLFNRASVVAVPSVNEPFPLIVLEAMASGVPVVAAASGGLVEAIEDGESGILFPTGDAGQLADALERVLTDPSLATQLSQRGRERARQEYFPQALAPKLRQLYNRVEERNVERIPRTSRRA